MKLTELSVVVVAHNHNPTLLNPDFLKVNGIVPGNWELAEPPLCADPFAQVRYKNGVAITTQPARLTFTEDLSDKRIEEAAIPAIARRYVTTLPHVDYQGVGINPRGHIVVGSPEEGRDLVGRLLAAGPWTGFRGVRPQVAVNLAYTFPDVVVNLQIEAAGHVVPEGKAPHPVILFVGNLHHAISAATPNEKVAAVSDVVSGFLRDCQLYNELVSDVIVRGIQ
jgi:hypothetical protein